MSHVTSITSIGTNLTTNIWKHKTEFFKESANSFFAVQVIVGLNKLNLIERLLVYLSFFGSLVLIIFIMSKCNKYFLLIKKRHQRYGFYLNQKYEQRLEKLNQNIFLFASNLLKRGFKANTKPKVLTKQIYSKLDIGHNNEMFEIEHFDSSFEVTSIQNRDDNFLTNIKETVSIKASSYESSNSSSVIFQRQFLQSPACNKC